MSNVEEFEDVGGSGKLVKTAKLAIGEAFKGKLIALKENTIFPGTDMEKKVTNLLMEEANGTPFTVFPSGSLNYNIKDNLLEVGQTYRVTRLENKTTKTGVQRTQFKVERLKSSGVVAAPGVNNAKPTGKSATK